MSNQAKFDYLRATFSFFCFQKYNYFVEDGEFFAEFCFSLDDKVFFNPKFSVPARDFYQWESIPKHLLDVVVFNIGMVELVSYWKIACPRKVIVRPFSLDEDQVRWWKKLYFNGLGEFFYVNGIAADIDSFMEIESCGEPAHVDNGCRLSLADTAIVPVGGGKDSVVTLELLKAKKPVIPFIINPRGATRECVAMSGFSEAQTATVLRTLDPTMLKMNAEGYLNGHTPFSALLAFYSVLVGLASKCGYIALSNESSANEPTVPDTEINHQYSKSVAFENDFRQYVKSYFNTDIQYFSFLRPLNELQIARLFSLLDNGFRRVFKSCNVGSKTDSWCGKCPKCLFTWFAMSPFINRKDLSSIFGKDLLKDNDLKPILHQLDGDAEVKPFECVGTVGEVRACLNHILMNDNDLNDTFLKDAAIEDGPSVTDFISQFDENNNLPDSFSIILKEALNG
ncbi:MAG: hypothetical protein ACI358_00280 [Candidatus Limimorpha sp.]